MENTLFPIEMKVHIIYALISLFVFGMQFIRLRKKYHLVLAIAVPASLLAYVIDSRAFFYALGIAEGAALIAALVLAKTVDRDKDEDKKENAAVQMKAAAEDAE